MIKVKYNKKPNLPICVMNCDVKLHDKLEKHDLTKFLNCHSCNLIVGKPGSGKTNLMYQLIKSKHLLNKCYDKIYLFQPSPSRASMKDNIFMKLPDDQKFEELTFENLDYVKNNLDSDENSAIFNYIRRHGGLFKKQRDKAIIKRTNYEQETFTFEYFLSCANIFKYRA